MNLEEELKRALRRTAAPPGLVERVFARLGEPGRLGTAKPAPGAKRPIRVRWLAAAAALAVGVTGGAEYYKHQQRLAEAERAEQQLRAALRVTVDTIVLVQRKLHASSGQEER